MNRGWIRGVVAVSTFRFDAAPQALVVAAREAQNVVGLHGRPARGTGIFTDTLFHPRIRSRRGHLDALPASGAFHYLSSHVFGSFQMLPASRAFKRQVRHRDTSYNQFRDPTGRLPLRQRNPVLTGPDTGVLKRP